jgi:murein DD-endopeptidase MepM/ murein hydrolase activator NlpD
MKRPRRRGGRGDWLAPLVALVIVTLLAWGGARGLTFLGWQVPWRGVAGWTAGASSEPAASTGVPVSATREPAIGPRSGDAVIEAAEHPARHLAEAAVVETSAVTTSGDIDRLRGRRLALPVLDIDPVQLRSNFHETRTQGLHEAIDILAPRGQPVIAVEGGTIAKLFTSVRGGLTVYQFDPSRQYTYYYAHLDDYASGLREGAEVTRGQVIGYVGTTGNAPKDTPHLHFAIFKLGPEQRWWQGTAIDPYIVFR